MVMRNEQVTCIVPSSAAKALPTLPAMIMAVTTGDNSLANANASTPPTDLVNPSLANSRTNCHIGEYTMSVLTGLGRALSINKSNARRTG